MSAPAFDPAKGRLRLAERTLAVLVAHTADPVAAAAEPGAVEHLAGLRVAGAIEGGRTHPALAASLAAIVRPEVCTLELAHSGKAARCWVSHSGAALLLPAADGEERRTLLALHPTLLPEALARLVDLRPRPRAPVGNPVGDGDPAVGTLRRRWRLVAAWTGDDGIEGGGSFEIVDASSGLWLADEAGLLWPATPTFAWRHIVRLLLRRTAAPEG